MWEGGIQGRSIGSACSALLLSVLALGLPRLGLAEIAAGDLSALQDEEFAIELSPMGRRASPRLAAMGGAGVASAEGAAALAINPAAGGAWGPEGYEMAIGDAILSTMFSRRGSTFQAGGLEGTGDQQLRGFGVGGSLQSGTVGFSAYLVGEHRSVSVIDPDASRLVTQQGGVHASWSLAQNQVLVAGGLLLAGMAFEEGGVRGLASGGVGYQAATLFKPRRARLRVGLRHASEVRSARFRCEAGEGCPRFLGRGFVMPARTSLGVALRMGPSAWNSVDGPEFRDERALILSADLESWDRIEGGQDAAAYLRGLALVSGAERSLWFRAGAEGEVSPGKLRLRAGAYQDPMRTEGGERRWHGTAGFELRILAYHSVGGDQRVGVSGYLDQSRDSQAAGFAIGKWN